MKVSIVIPNYNGEKLLEKNLGSVLDAIRYFNQQTKNSADLVISDDKSTDASIVYLKNLAEHTKDVAIHIVEKKKNEGFAAAVNEGVNSASGDIVVLFNTDASAQKDFLVPLIKHFSDEKVFAVGCMDKSIEGEKTIERGRGIGVWHRGLLIHARGEVDKNDTLWVSGGSGAFRKSIWHQLGGLRRIYNPFYWEDIDLSYQAIKRGFKLIFEPRSIATHTHEEGVIKKKFSEKHITKIAYRNQLLFSWMNLTDKHLFRQHMVWLPVQLLHAFMEDSAFVSGFFLALLRLPQALSYRKKGVKHYVKTDVQVTSPFAQEMKQYIAS